MQSALERDEALAMLERAYTPTRTAALSPTTCPDQHNSDQHPA
jgi:hypothetical protein